MKAALRPQPTIAIMILDGAVYLYAETLRFLAWKFRHSGFKVIRIGCSHALDTCTSINSINKSDLERVGRESICNRCEVAQVELSADEVVDVTKCDFESLRVADSFLVELQQRLKETQKIADVLNMQYAEFPVCCNAFFDFSITTKLACNVVLNDDALSKFFDGVKDQIKLIQVFKKVHERNDITHLVYVNGNYSQNTLARQFFAKLGVVCLSVEPQLTSQACLNRTMIAPSRLFLNPEGLHRRISEDECIANFSVVDGARVLKNFGARIFGADFNAYTSLNRSLVSKEEFARVAIFLQTYSRIHSFFMSSEDELGPHICSHNAVNSGKINTICPFKTQAEFLSYLIHNAHKNPKIGYIIRLHPRMAANKRDYFESNEHIRYKKILMNHNIPNNIIVIYGDSEISSYFLIFKSDLVIIAWSTIGLEALLLGASVVSAFPSCLMYPLASFSRQPLTWPEFEKAVFRKSNYGVPHDRSLLGWVSQAHESQFFPTAAPRGKGGIIGSCYRICYRILGRMGMYGLVATGVNTLFLRHVRFDEERLFVKSPYTRYFPKLRMYILDKMIARYRSKYRKAFYKYSI